MPSPSIDKTASRRDWAFALAGLAAVGLIGLASILHRAMLVQPSPRSAAAPVTEQSSRSGASSPAIVEEDVTDPPLPSTLFLRHSPDSLEARGYALAWNNPAAAFRKLAGLDAQDRLEWTRGIFKVLAQGNVIWALAYAKQIPPGPERQAALTALVEGWGYAADESPEQQATCAAAFGPDADIGLLLLTGASPRPDLAVLWAEQLTSGQGRTQFLGEAAVMQAPTDPAMALSYGSGLEGDAQVAFDAMMVRGWTLQQPDDAWQWSSSLADPVQREEMQALSISELSQMDPAAAVAQWALLPSDDDRIRQDALAEVAASYARQNANAAMAWAQTLPANDQEVAQASIHRQVPSSAGW